MKTIGRTIAVISVIVISAFAATAQTSLTSIEGVKVDIHGQRGKVVILAVGASWLPLSDKQAEFTNVLAKRYVGKDVVVFFVATDSGSSKSKNFASNDDIRKFAGANKLTVRILRDPDGETLIKKFDLDQLPAFVVLDKNGTQVGETFGGIDPKYDVTAPLSKIVDPLLN
ncbi:MAG: TlpA disulfide reductase family protein [Pyrinomonadaceae bacterium]